MTHNLTRRQVARLFAACLPVGAAASLLAACGPLALPSAQPTATPPPTQTDTPTPAEAVVQATAVDTPVPAPTDTVVPPTDTAIPPTATATDVPPTATAAPTFTPAPTPTGTPVPVGPIQSNPDGQFAMLLLGYGGPGHDGPYLTDSMMVLIANPAKKTLTVLSLARDCYVPLSYTGGAPNTYDKLNTAYAYAHDTKLYTNRIARYKGTNGPGNMAKDTVSQILGIPIDYFLAIDFQGFKNVIDTLGGIDLTVQNSFTARYPVNDNASINAAWEIVKFNKGPQHMNGQKALEYARAREVLDNTAEVGDFARATRQRIVLTAVKDRVLQPAGLLHLPQLLSIASKSSVTDYPLPAVTNLVGFVTSWGDVKIYQAALSTSNYLQLGTGKNGTYLLLPRADGLSWQDVRAFGRRLYLDPALGTQLAQTEVMVLNRSGKDGLATQVTARLAALGYEMESPQTGSAQATSDVIDQSGGTGDAMVAALGPDLGMPALNLKADKAGSPRRIVLELGKDAVGIALTDVPAPDSDTPTSNVGVVKVGTWSP